MKTFKNTGILFLCLLSIVGLIYSYVFLVQKNSTLNLDEKNIFLLNAYTGKLDDKTVIFSKGNGTFTYGPYINLPPGQYVVDFWLKTLNKNQQTTNQEKEKVKITISIFKSGPVNTLELNGHDIDSVFKKYSVDFESLTEKDQYEFVVSGENIQIAIDKITVRYKNQFKKVFSRIFLEELFIGSAIFVLGVYVSSSLLAKFIFKKNKFLILGLFVLIAIGIQLLFPQPITGDEPHYLINTRNLLLNRTLSLKNAYAYDFIKSIYKGKTSPHVSYSEYRADYFASHQYLLSLILTMPYFFAEVTGAKIFMAIIAGLTTFLLFKNLGFIGLDFKWRFMLALLFLIASPTAFFSYAIYPEILAAFILMLTFYVFYNQKPHLVILASILLGQLPNLGIKYLPVSLVSIFLFFAFNRKKTTKIYIAIFYLLSFMTFPISLKLLYNSFHPYSFYFGDNIKAVSSLRIKKPAILITNFLSHFLDVESGIFVLVPMIILAILGFYTNLKEILINLKDSFKFKNCMLVCLPICHIGTYAFFNSRGGACPRGRPLIAVLPIFFLLVGNALRLIKNKIIILFLATFSVYNIAGIFYTNTVIPNPKLTNSFYTSTGDLFINLSIFLPKLEKQSIINTEDLAQLFFFVNFCLLVLIMATTNFKKKIKKVTEYIKSII